MEKLRKSLARKSRRSTSGGTALDRQVAKLDLPPTHKQVFPDRAEVTKKKLRENMHKPRYDVANFYKTEGKFQEIARDGRFESITLGIISFNALWIAIDCDANDAEVLHEAHAIFILAENLFCIFFTFELTVRFGAFQDKRNCLRDAWFVFDAFMVVMMIMETWVMTIVLVAIGGSSGGLGNTSLLRLLRLLRLSRLARMARLLRSMPELLILIKGMFAAVRSVFFTLLLLMLLLYVYAILFRQLTAETTLGEQYFPSILRSMNQLTLDGIFFCSMGDLVGMMIEENEYVLLVVFYIFVLLATFTILNMLIGVLCDVVSSVGEVEHEQLTIQAVSEQLKEIVNQTLDVSNIAEGEELQITKKDFLEILAHKDSAMFLDEEEINVFALVDLVDTIFASEDGKDKVLTFSDLVEILLDQRGNNEASVKDGTELRKYIRGRIDRAEKSLEAQMVTLGRMIEMSKSLPPGTYQAEVSQCKKELQLGEYGEE